MTKIGNAFHAVLSQWHTSSNALIGERWRACLTVIHEQMFLMDDRSVDHAGHGSNRVPRVSMKVKTLRETYGLELSFRKMVFGSPQRQGTTIGSKRSEMYRSAVKLTSIRTRDVHFVYPMATQIITLDAKSLCLYRMKVFECKLANAFSSEYPDMYKTIKIVHTESNSPKRRYCATFCIYLCHSVLQSRWLSLYCIVKESGSNGRRAESTRFCKSRVVARANRYWALCKHVYLLTNSPFYDYMVL